MITDGIGLHSALVFMINETVTKFPIGFAIDDPNFSLLYGYNSMRALIGC